MASSSSSSNYRTPSSSPNVRHHSLENLSHLESNSINTIWNDHSTSDGRRIAIQSVQLANQLQHIQVNTDVNNIARTMDAASRQILCRRNESLAEEELIERLKEIINKFMTRSDRRHSTYNRTLRWTVDHDNQFDYSVTIVINQPSDLI